MTAQEQEEKIAELRAEHGEVEVLDIPARDGREAAIVVVRAMALDDFLELQHNEERRSRGVKLRDPREITAPLLACVVFGAEEANAELKDAPGFEFDLMSAVSRLGGALRDDISVEFTEEPAPGKPLVLAVAKNTLTFRRLDSFDYSNARSSIGKYSRDCPGLISPLAMMEICKRQIVKEQADDFKRVASLYPAAVHGLGLLLWRSAQSLAERRAGK